MDICFNIVNILPEELIPGGIYFEKESGTIHVVNSDNNITSYLECTFWNEEDSIPYTGVAKVGECYLNTEYYV